MIHLRGKTVFGGIVSGTVYVSKRECGYEYSYNQSDAAEELKRLKDAVSAVKEELSLCADKAENETAREIFEIHCMMLEDEDILDFLENSVVNDGKTAREAVSLTEDSFSQMFRDTQDDYMIARIDDIRDVCGSLTAYLSGKKSAFDPQEPFVLVTDELLPSDLMRFGNDKLAGIVTASGSVYSHASILIKEMAIPAIICGSVDGIKSGMSVLLDADGGEAFFDPDEKTKEEAERRIQSSGAGKTAFSSEFLPYKVYVNIGSPKEVSAGLMERCDGIGLFRTEYMYLQRSRLPDEDEQLAAYRDILEKAKGKPVIVRTFDIGSDKSVEALAIEKEENPALGFRGLRVYSLYGDVFRTQIRALLRAAVYGDLHIMYPMVTSADEIGNIKSIVAQTADELTERGIEYRMPKQGAMIETPAAAVLSDELAGTADFFSVGTNDLAQYTYALDRQASNLADFYDESNKAVLALVKMAADNAHKNGIKIGICGELAGNPAFAEKWAQLGIDYISVSPSLIRR